MYFILIAYDGKDNKALERRMAVREEHLKNADKMTKDGTLLFAVGILDESEKMIGSMMVVDFSSREDMEKQWLNTEPYIIGNVWDKIEIKQALIPPVFQDNK